MPNQLFRNRLAARIAYGIAEARNATAFKHAGFVGRVREIATEDIISPMLPTGYAVGAGKITDRHGALSSEIDLAIYHPAVLPPVLFSPREGVFPVESCSYAIEVKSRLSATELRDAVEKTCAIYALDYGAQSPTPRSSLVVCVLLRLRFRPQDRTSCRTGPIPRHRSRWPHNTCS